MSHSTAIAPSREQGLSLEPGLSRLPPLRQTFEAWHSSGSSEASHALERRAALLDAATLSPAGLRLLYDIASRQIEALRISGEASDWLTRPLHQRIVYHAATHSAAQTQAVLPAGALVQKTVTVAIGGQWLLCTRIADQEFARKQLGALAQALALPQRAAKRCTINPDTCDPVREYGMQPGMVSPFLCPLHRTKLAALVLIPWPQEWDEREQEGAVSLSLWESLLLPLRCLREIMLCYARQAYPHLQLIEVQREENQHEHA